VKGTPQQIAVALRRFARAMEPAVQRAELESAKEAKKIAVRLSSGKLTTRQLRKLGHPYRKGGAPPQDPAIINRQSKSGGFRDSWKVGDPERTAKGSVVRLVNTAPHATFLKTGTDRMIARPIDKRIRELLAPKRKAALEKHLRRAAGGE
jgi:hypothetical protein